MAGNTGYQGWRDLEQYLIATGIATGVTKANIVTDPDYIAPQLNLGACPVNTFTSTRSQYFQKNDCISGVGSTLMFTKTYTSTISQTDADLKASSDPSFTTEGQAYVNANGYCQIPTHTVTVELFMPTIQTGQSDYYSFILTHLEPLVDDVTVTMEIKYSNWQAQTSYTTITKTLYAGQTESNNIGWDITDGSPAGEYSSIQVLSYTSTPAEGDEVKESLTNITTSLHISFAF